MLEGANDRLAFGNLTLIPFALYRLVVAGEIKLTVRTFVCSAGIEGLRAVWTDHSGKLLFNCLRRTTPQTKRLTAIEFSDYLV